MNSATAITVGLTLPKTEISQPTHLLGGRGPYVVALSPSASGHEGPSHFPLILET